VICSGALSSAGCIKGSYLSCMLLLLLLLLGCITDTWRF
jgi:hypothetical protein